MRERLFGLVCANKPQEQQSRAGSCEHANAIGHFVQPFGIAPGVCLQDFERAAEYDQRERSQDDRTTAAQGRRRQSRQPEISQEMQEFI